MPPGVGTYLRSPGVYLIVRNAAHACVFAPTSCGGRFRAKNPTVPLSRLHRQWIDDAIVIYIGKAGGQEAARLALSYNDACGTTCDLALASPSGTGAGGSYGNLRTAST